MLRRFYKIFTNVAKRAGDFLPNIILLLNPYLSVITVGALSPLSLPKAKHTTTQEVIFHFTNRT